MSTLAAFVGIVLFGWGIRALYNVAVGNELRKLAVPPDDLSRLRERYATTDMTMEEYERGVERVLGESGESKRAPYKGGLGSPTREKAPDLRVHTPPLAPAPAERLSRVEIHVHGAPPGHHLHIHL